MAASRDKCRPLLLTDLRDVHPMGLQDPWEGDSQPAEVVPPGNRLEVMRGDLRGKHSIRINDQWRIVFRWKDGDAHDVEIMTTTEE